MHVRYSEWKKPTDAAYAFQLRAAEGPGGFRPERPPLGVRTDIQAVAREVLEPGEAERFERRLARWSGPEDRVGEAGEQPWVGEQRSFEEGAWKQALTMREVEPVLAGHVRVMRGPEGQTDYVLRDHHMLDVALYHYRTTGELPRALFHADRHSDWCKDSFLEARVPPQAATWWKLFEGLKRPAGGEPVLGEQDIHFTTVKAAPTASMTGRDVGFSTLVPWHVDTTELHWRHVLARPAAAQADWVSLDLDYFQPAPQLRLCRELVRVPAFHTLLARARVRVFVLSPQFTNGGDKIDPWVVQGSLHSSLRLMNLLRQLPGKVRVQYNPPP